MSRGNKRLFMEQPPTLTDTRAKLVDTPNACEANAGDEANTTENSTPNPGAANGIADSTPNTVGAKLTARQITKKVASLTVSVLLWVVLALSILLVVFSLLSRLKNEKGVGLFGLGMYQIVSGSMEPEIKIGDVILGKRSDFEKLKVNQNVIFYDKGRDIIITHKIIAIGDGFVTTHGIANPDGANETVLAADILAVQVFKIPALGVVLNFLRTPAGFFLIIFLPIGALILYQSIGLKKQLKQYKAENSAPNGEAEQLKSEIAELKRQMEKSAESNTIEKSDSKKTTLPKDNIDPKP